MLKFLGSDGSLPLSLPGLSKNAVALVTAGETWTRGRVAAAAAQLAAGFVAAGVKPGDRIALHLRNGPEILLLFMACFAVGAIAVPLNLRFKSAELEAMLRRIRPMLYFGDASLYELVSGLEDDVLSHTGRFLIGSCGPAGARDWTDLRCKPPSDGFSAPGSDCPALLLSTSGTTGQPKLVVHSHGGLRVSSDNMAEMLFCGPNDRVGHFVPMVHSSGIRLALAALRHGVTEILLDATDPSGILDGIERERCTVLLGLPTSFMYLMDHQRQKQRDVSSLSLCAAAGDVCLPGQQEEFSRLFGLPLRSFWASSEATGSFTYGLVPGPVSRPATGVETRVVDGEGRPVPTGEVGEAWLRGPHIALGYWTGPGCWDGFPNGWYPSGDQMREDGHGNFWFVSRTKDLIVRAGSNISPIEVEHVLLGHPAIRDAAVAGLPDPVLGQRVVAFIVLADRENPGAIERIRSDIRPLLADYKLPEDLFPIDQVPRNGAGKIDRKLVALLRVESR